MAPLILSDTLELSAGLTQLGDAAFDREPLGGGPLVRLLLTRPGQARHLSVIANDGGRLAGWIIGSQSGTTGFIDTFAVGPSHRRRGVATALLAELESRLRSVGAHEFAVGGNDRFYAWPGVDSGYAEAHALLAARGYRVVDRISNMDLALDGDFRMPSLPLASPLGPVSARRATAADAAALAEFAARDFPDTPWQHEVLVALAHDPPGVHLGTLPDGRVVGFACHGTYRPDWFGPLGTMGDVRGSGLGAALLTRCLADLAAAGHPEAQICWIGPADFYTRTVGARIRRQFTVFGRTPHGGPAGAAERVPS